MNKQPETMELVPMDKRATPEPVDLIAIVARACMSPEVDPAKMREILAMRKELDAERAKKEFDEAFAAFQSEVPVIDKGKGVPDRSGNVAYKYAPLEDIAATIKPFLQKHGFSYRFDTDVQSEPGWVIAHCDVKHSGGHKERSTAKFPLGTQTGIMSATQVYAAALTFASRRVLTNAFGLTLAGEDLDGRLKQKGKGLTGVAVDKELKALAQELWTLLKPVRGSESNWKLANQWMQDEMVLTPEEFAPDLDAERFRQVIAAAKKKMEAK